MTTPRRIAHIVNPVAVRETSDLYLAQPITFESMRAARDRAAGKVDVSLHSAQYAEDRTIVPPWLEPTPDLERSIMDCGRFATVRKLPLVADILQRLYEASDAEYFVYTNVDIGLQPHFYTAVDDLIRAGHDALIINRRTLPADYRTVEDLPRIWADPGESHPGYDCFVFRRDAFPKYQLGRICVGVPMIGVVLAANLACFARKFREFRDLHLTFHIGDDGVWKRHGMNDYFRHNTAEGEAILNALAPRFDPKRLPKVGMPNLAEYFAWVKAGAGRGRRGR